MLNNAPSDIIRKTDVVDKRANSGTEQTKEKTGTKVRKN